MKDSPEARPAVSPSDPFAYPADTDFRFALLIISVAASALFVYRWLYHGSQIGGQRYSEAVQRCFSGRGPAADASLEELIAVNQGIQACMASVNQETGLWMLGGTLVLFTTGLALYWLYPAWRIRRGGFEPLTETDAPQVVEHLNDLCERAGLETKPDFLWNPLDPALGGLAFGRWGSYRVALSGGLVTTFITDRPTFDAVVLHELAHLKNGDVDKAYWSLAIWYAFLAVGLVPLAFDLIDNSASEILSVAWRVAGLAALVYLIRNSVLRARELFADARMAQWSGSLEQLASTLGSILRRRSPRPGLLRAHPPPEERMSTLSDAARLLRFSAWDALAAGVAGSVMFASLHTLLGTVLYTSEMPMLPAIGAALVVAAVAVGVIGLGMWRETYQAVTSGTRRGHAGRLGLVFGVGLVIGRPIALENFVEPYTYYRDLPTIVARFGFSLMWAIVVVLALALFFRWIQTGAGAWISGNPRAEPPAVPLVLGLSLAAIVLAAWLGPALWLRGYDASINEMILAVATAVLAVPSVVPTHPLTHISLLAIWGFPLAGAVLGRTSSPALQHEDRARALRPALLAAGIAALTFAALVMLGRLGLYVGLDESTRESDTYKLLLYGGHLALAFILQAILGIFVAMRARILPVLSSLFSAHLAAGLMAAITLIGTLTFGGSPDLSFAWSTFSHMAFGGALVVLPIALVTAGLARRTPGAH